MGVRRGAPEGLHRFGETGAAAAGGQHDDVRVDVRERVHTHRRDGEQPDERRYHATRIDLMIGLDPYAARPRMQPRLAHAQLGRVERDDACAELGLVSPEPRELGKGGSQHRYVQHLVKGLAEERGFRAVIEEAIGGGQIDVALYRDDLSIACEISVTSTPQYEAQNLAKCSQGRFSRVFAIAADAKRL